MASKPPSLMSRRFRALAQTLIGVEGSGRAAARRIGMPDTTFAEYARGEKNAETRDIELAARKLGVKKSFFTDDDLGEAPDYRAHLDTRVEYDVDQGHALTRVREIVEAFLASDEGAPYERFRGELLATYGSRSATTAATIRSYAHDLEAQERTGPRRAPPPAKPTEGARKLESAKPRR
jgi:hypothetical protein